MAAMDGSLSDLLLHGGRFEAIFGSQGVEMVADNAVGTKNFAAALRLPCGGRQDRERRDSLGLTPCGVGLGRWGFQPRLPRYLETEEADQRAEPFSAGMRGAECRWRRGGRAGPFARPARGRSVCRGRAGPYAAW